MRPGIVFLKAIKSKQFLIPFLNIFLQDYYPSYPVIEANKLSNHNSWITSGKQASCKHKK